MGSGFNDDPLWLIAGTVYAYIKETGDFSILMEQVTPFDNDRKLCRQPLMEHLRRSVTLSP